MDKSERLAPGGLGPSNRHSGGEVRRRSSLIERRHSTAANAAADRAALGDAMGEYPSTIWGWVGCTEQELHGAVRDALNDYYL